MRMSISHLRNDLVTGATWFLLLEYLVCKLEIIKSGFMSVSMCIDVHTV